MTSEGPASMAVPYDFREIEDRWRQRWDAAALDRLDLDTVDRSELFYNLVEFPYPSAEGLHVGHVFKYSGADAYGRYQRMRGNRCSSPSASTHSASTPRTTPSGSGRHPLALTRQTTEAFRAQLSHGGMAWDWSRCIDTSQPGYYRWTQWILTKLFGAGLLYQANAPVVWCPSCLTVLAREQTEVESGETVCERCSTPGRRTGDVPVVLAYHRICGTAPGGPGRTGLARAGQAPATAMGRAFGGAGDRLR